MSIDYTQYCMIGFSVKQSELKVVDSEEKFELQNRYDPYTGKLKGQEKVVIEYEKSHLEFPGLGSFRDGYCLDQAIIDTLDVNCSYNYETKTFYIGTLIGEMDSHGSVDFLTGIINFDELLTIKKELETKFPDREISLMFFSNVR